MEAYLYQIGYLQRYGLFKFLTPELRRQRFKTEQMIDVLNVPKDERRIMLAKDPSLMETQIDTWLGGTEPSRKALLAFFHELALSRVKDRVTLRANVMSPHGAVEQWTYHFLVGHRVRLEGLDVMRLCPEGTFPFPLIQ